MKKIIIIIIAVVFILAVAFGVYFGWKKSKEILEPPISNQQSIIDNQQQTAAKQRLKIIGNQPAFGYWINSIATSSQIFYFNQDGQIFKIKADGDEETISERIIENIQKIEADKDGEKVIVEFGDKNNSQFEIFDVEKKIWQRIKNASAASFSPDGKQIAYFDGVDLIVKNLLDPKQKTQKILSLSQKDFDLKWIASDRILLIPKPSSLISANIWEINLKTKALKIFAGDKGLTVNFAKDNSIGLKFSVNERREGALQLIGNSGAIMANLNFLTLPNKCLINLVKIYCAIPQSYNSVSEPILPDDYLKRATYSNDFIYELNLGENSFLPIFEENNSSIDAIDLELLENQLFFINRYDNRIYRLEL